MGKSSALLGLETSASGLGMWSADFWLVLTCVRDLVVRIWGLGVLWRLWVKTSGVHGLGMLRVLEFRCGV